MKENLVSYNGLFIKNNYNKLLRIKINNINLQSFLKEILREVYIKKWKSSTNKVLSGVYDTGYDLDVRGRSLLNWVNSSYMVLPLILNWLNKEILSKTKNPLSSISLGDKYTQIDFYLSDWTYEMNKLFKIIYDYKYVIFNKNSDILNSILLQISSNHKIGDKAEQITINELVKKGINRNNIRQSKPGEKKDANLGIDIEFIHNNKKYTIQTKSYSTIKKNNNNYIITGISKSKRYKNINLFSFYNPKYGFYLFDNDPKITIPEYNTMIIPANLLRFNN